MVNFESDAEKNLAENSPFNESIKLNSIFFNFWKDFENKIVARKKLGL